MKPIYRLIIIFLLPLSGVLPVHADQVDRDWEQQISKKLAEEAKATEVCSLEADGEKFLGLYTSQTAKVAHGAAIILHGMGGHADWPQLISPLRTALPGQGWSTLSIQLPVIAPQNQIEDYGLTLQQAADRIDAAVRFLRDRKFLNIVVVGHSFGAASALAYLEKENKQKIRALVAIGLQDYAFVKPVMNVLGLIEKSHIPILDIYGSRDYKNVIDQAPDRRLAARKGNNQNYSQFEIEGADHYFDKMDDVLVKRIRGWLDKAAPGVSIEVDEDFDGNKEEQESTPAEQ